MRGINGFVRASRTLAIFLLMFVFAATASAQDEVDATVLSEVQLVERAQEAGISEEGIQELLALRQATEPFVNIDAAVTAGWPEDLTGCLDFPDGYLNDSSGAMGHHFINLSVFRDGGALDPTKPEALLYETQADGSLRLTGVEFIIPESDLSRDADPPVLFGKEMLFHPQFESWAHHVWLWRDNPYGLFADVNPDVSCEFAPQQ
jgi:hypothetical protein